MRLSRTKLLIKLYELGFGVDTLKLPNKRKLSYIELKNFKARFISLINEISFFERGL